MPRLTLASARLAVAAASGNYAAAARAIGCTVARLRAVLGAPPARRGRKPLTPPVEAAQVAYDRALSSGDVRQLAAVGGARAVARATGIAETTIRRRIEAAKNAIVSRA